MPLPEDGVRRFLTDLRSGGDRRSGRDRRRSSRPGSHDRRTEDRRQPLAQQFSVAQGLLIREMVLRPNLEAACPACNGNLMLGPPEKHAGTRMQEVHCTACRRHALLVYN
ncbi:MAG: hypothetical protein JSW43_08940 [Gemmatimonadota bacterium]|nr:MAG: hypothetical protein JSW43_08940 [Gemmatimonadota bacterium]